VPQIEAFHRETQSERGVTQRNLLCGIL